MRWRRESGGGGIFRVCVCDERERKRVGGRIFGTEVSQCKARDWEKRGEGGR